MGSIRVQVDWVSQDGPQQVIGKCRLRDPKCIVGLHGRITPGSTFTVILHLPDQEFMESWSCVVPASIPVGKLRKVIPIRSQCALIPCMGDSPYVCLLKKGTDFALRTSMTLHFDKQPWWQEMAKIQKEKDDKETALRIVKRSREELETVEDEIRVFEAQLGDLKEKRARLQTVLHEANS